MKEAYLSLGGNQGDRINFLQRALELIAAQCGSIVKQSSVYETAAWGLKDQPDFLNMVALIQTTLAPENLLSCILAIEKQLGRHRDVKWGPRTIDIDILFYNHQLIETPDLIIPHPFLQERRFTLLPLSEIAPLYKHPKFHKSIIDLLGICPDKLEVRHYANNKLQKDN